MATYTAANAQPTVQPRYQLGTVAVRGLYNANGLTVSAGDVIQMVKIPHGARIVDLYVAGSVPIDAGTITVGDGGSANRFITTTSISTGPVFIRMNNGAGAGFQYSFSDDAVNQFDTIDITIATAASVTVTCSLQLVVKYAMPGNI